MTEILFENIDNFKISELSEYFFNTTDLTRKISRKKIKDVDTFDLLHLVRRRNYTELATELAIRYFEEKGFNGYSFNYDDKSIAEQDLLKELVLLDGEFWKYNQDSFRKLKPIVEKNGCYLNLSDNLIQLFLEINPKKIIWSKEETERIKPLVDMDAASTVHSAWEMIRRLKRAIDEGIEVEFKWKDRAHKIRTVEDLVDKVISHLPYPNDFKKVLNKEIKIKKLQPTMGIKHRADSGFRKFLSLSKLSFGRTVKSFEMPYVSYPNRCAVMPSLRYGTTAQRLRASHCVVCR